MKIFVHALLFAVIALVSSSSVNKDRYFMRLWQQRILDEVVRVVNLPQVPDRYLSGEEFGYQTNKISKPVLKFSYNNCGTASDPIQINKLSISPDPIKLPGDLTVTFDGSTSVNVTDPFQVSMTIKKKVVFFWVEIPCVDGVGSCDYDDFCPTISSVLNPCPASFVKAKIPCSCPFQQGQYFLDQGVISLPSIPLPSWASSGDYSLHLVASNNGKQLLCVDVDLTLD